MMYLVTIGTSFDDVPVRFCNNEAEARRFAVNLCEHTAEELKERILAHVFGRDNASLVNTAIVTFDDSGTPIKHDCIRSYT